MPTKDQSASEALVLTNATLERLVTQVGLNDFMTQLIARLNKVFAESADGGWEIPVRDGFNYEVPFPGLVEWMPVMRRGDKVLMKVVGYHPMNPQKHGMATIQSLFAMINTQTGALEALLDGEFLTALRTGAASGVATDLLATESSTVLGLIGAGAQAVTQVHGVCSVRPIDELLVHDIDALTARSFDSRLPAEVKGSAVVRVCSVEEVLAQSDVLCVATSVPPGEGPVFCSGTKIRPHLHINAIGSDFPGKIELPKTLLEQAYVTPDFLGQALKEGESQQLSSDEIGAELRAFCRGEIEGKALRDQLTVFDSTGYALEDFVVAEIAIEMATAGGLGERLAMSRRGGDPKSPYGFAAAVGEVQQVSDLQEALGLQRKAG